MKKSICILTVSLLMLLPVVSNAQSNASKAYTMFSLLTYKGKPVKPKFVISYSDTLSGYIIYDNEKIESDFSIENNYIANSDRNIFLGDKKITCLNLHDNEKTIRIERVKYDGYLKRVVIDTLGFKVYDQLSLSDKIYKETLFFEYKNEYYFVERAIFRGLNASIRRTLNKIKFDDPDLKNAIIARLDL